MVGKRLKEARLLKGLTLEQLSDLYNEKFDGGLNKGTLSKYENGKQQPLSDVIGNLALILGVSADFLIGAGDDAEVLINDIVYRITRGGMTYGGKPLCENDAKEIAYFLEKCMENMQKQLD